MQNSNLKPLFIILMEKVGCFYLNNMLKGRDGYIVHDSGGAVAPLKALSSRIPNSYFSIVILNLLAL